ncbi:MAG: 50S ribosomal protein L15 [Candidatus Magasanikbacteria bacterium]
MTLEAHTIKNTTNSKQTSKRVGRGNGSGKGTYAARGLKGQRSRSGGKSGTKRRGLKANIQKVPKVRGFKSIHAKAQTVTLSTLERIVEKGGIINLDVLLAKGVIKNIKDSVKIVATGEIKKPLEIHGCLATKTAIAAIEKAGGKLVV